MTAGALIVTGPEGQRREMQVFAGFLADRGENGLRRCPRTGRNWAGVGKGAGLCVIVAGRGAGQRKEANE
jgi:hypothetical protein